MERTKKGKSAKNKIVTAAWQLFHEKGYNGTTVDDIIALSGTSKGSFYYYFNTKDELLNTLSVILDDFYEELEGRMNPDMNSFVKLLNVNYEAHKMIEANISIDLIASLYSTLDQNRTYYKFVTRIVTEGQMRGQIRNDMSATEITKYFTMCERALVSDWCLSRGEFSLSEYSRRCMPIMLEHFKA